MTAPEIVVRSILVATDFSPHSEQAIRAAAALAQHFGAALHMLHVVRHEDERPAALDRLAGLAEAEGGGAPFAATVAIGRPAPEIVSYAEREQMDLVVVGTHGRTGLAHLVMGSVAEAVVRTAPCQVLTIHLRPAPATAPVRETAAPAPVAGESHCFVCARPSRDRICESCAARIRGEALERLLEDERAGRQGSSG